MKFKVNKFANGDSGISIWKEGMTGEYIELPTKDELESGCFVSSHQTSEVAAIKSSREQNIKDLCRFLQTGHIIASLMADYLKQYEALLDNYGFQQTDRATNIGFFYDMLEECIDQHNGINTIEILRCFVKYMPQGVDQVNIELLLTKGQYDD